MRHPSPEPVVFTITWYYFCRKKGLPRTKEIGFSNFIRNLDTIVGEDTGNSQQVIKKDAIQETKPSNLDCVVHIMAEQPKSAWINNLTKKMQSWEKSLFSSHVWKEYFLFLFKE